MDQKIKSLLMTALSSQQRGDLTSAEAACRQILEIDENQADALQFLGLIEETKGKTGEAERLFNRSLEINPRQPHVLNNLGNLFHQTGRDAEALGCYEKAITLKPDFADAWFNRGRVNFSLGNLDVAEKALLKAQKYWAHREPKPLSVLASLYQKRKDFDNANKFFRRALAIKPDHFKALFNYALSLKMQQRHTEALEVFAKALKIEPENPDLLYNIGNVHYELGDLDTAFSYYQKTIALKADHIDAHIILNELLWRQGKKQDYVASYREACKKRPDSLPLKVHYLEALVKADIIGEAKQVLREAQEKFPESAPLWHINAALAGKTGNPRQTEKALLECIKCDPEDVTYLQDLAKIYLKAGRVEEALGLMEKAQAREPFDQRNLAYLGLCWRLLGNDKEKWLNDYKKFVRAYEIPVPPGYRNIGEFNSALNTALDKFHTDEIEPSDQTLRGGTQTIAALLEKNVKEIREVRKSFEQVIARYISELPDDPDHPFLSRKSKNFTFSGSWSIRLRGEGFHVNHVHPEGWLSSSYYVSLPDVMKNSKDQQGWIKFGESPLELGNKEKIGRIIQPKEGTLVLFPSYTFHGTNPFYSKQTRTTLPFDVVPIFS